MFAIRLFADNIGAGSVSLTAIGTPYVQNFNALAASGTGTSLPDGWRVVESGANANTSYTAGTGSSNAGDTYSFGAASDADRALGTLRSGNLIPTIGVIFANNTGQTITSLDVSYTGEQWRLGTSRNSPDRLDFQISPGAASLDDAAATWTDVNALDFVGPVGSGTVGALNGNGVGNRVLVSASITGLTIAPGSNFGIRWTDFDASGSDDGLAIDDFSITPQSNPTTTGPSGVGAAVPAAVSPGDPTLLTITTTAGTPPETITSVTVDLTAIGGAADQAFFDDATHGDATAGDAIYSFSATVASGTPAANKSLPFIVADAAGRSGSGAITLAVQAPAVVTPIHDIQGPGALSPFANQMVTTEGIVTARRFNNGFFIQAPDAEADADPTTSEGVFVFTSTAPSADAAVGNRVRVTGTVQEFRPGADPNSPPETEIATPVVTLLSTGNALPAAVALTIADTNPAGPFDQLERFEGMRVHVDVLNVIAPTQGTVNEPNATASTNGVYFGLIPGIPRPVREPGIEVPDPLPAGSPCCIPRFDANPERIRVDSNGQASFGANDTTEVMTGAIVTNITGVLDYQSRAYTILPDFGAQGSVSGLHGFSAVSAAGAHQFTIGTANLERFFDTVDDAGISDVALTPAAFANRLIKVSRQIRDVMRTPDIIGVEEVENIGVLQAIANQVNADSADAVHYVAYLFEGNDPGGIDDGLLVNTLRVTVRGAHQEGKDTTFIDPTNGQPALLNDRPPTVLDATIVTSDDAPLDVTVVANHLRSLNGIDDATDGPRVRAKRLAQAEFTGHLVETLEQNSPGVPIVAVGDFNSFEFSDGYVDVIGTIKGTPAPADQVVLASSNVPNVASPLTDLIELDSTPQRYSYSFDGNAQSLDHMLATSAAVARFAGIEWGHSNADFPESFRGDFTRPERLSDHDPVVAYFTLPATTTTTVVASPNPAPFGQDVTFTATVQAANATVGSGSIRFSDGAGYSSVVAVSNGAASVTVPAASFGIGSHSMTADFADGASFASSTGSTSFSVADLKAPVISGLGNIVAEAASAAGAQVAFAPTAADDVDGPVPVQCSPVSGSVFPLGATVVNCAAHDAAGNVANGSFSVTVRDTIAPSAPTLTVSPAVLFPPNNKLVTVRVTATSSDGVDSTPTCTIQRITSTSGDTGDFKITGPLTASLRAKKNHGDAPQIYSLFVSCADDAGNTSATASVQAVVEHDQGHDR
jgi:hypothetical protein